VINKVVKHQGFPARERGQLNDVHGAILANGVDEEPIASPS
jgi:hypothetical protein